MLTIYSGAHHGRSSYIHTCSIRKIVRLPRSSQAQPSNCPRQLPRHAYINGGEEGLFVMTRITIVAVLKILETLSLENPRV